MLIETPKDRGQSIAKSNYTKECALCHTTVGVFGNRYTKGKSFCRPCYDRFKEAYWRMIEFEGDKSVDEVVESLKG